MFFRLFSLLLRFVTFSSWPLGNLNESLAHLLSRNIRWVVFGAYFASAFWISLGPMLRESLFQTWKFFLKISETFYLLGFLVLSWFVFWTQWICQVFKKIDDISYRAGSEGKCGLVSFRVEFSTHTQHIHNTYTCWFLASSFPIHNTQLFYMCTQVTHMYTHVKYITSTQLFVLFVFLLLFLLDQNL